MQKVPDLRKTRICKAFLAGMCNTPDCSFAHGEDELRSTDLCYKKTMCSWFEKGCCRNGDSCRFAHGVEELRLAPGTADSIVMPVQPGTPPSKGKDLKGNTSSKLQKSSTGAPEKRRSKASSKLAQLGMEPGVDGPLPPGLQEVENFDHAALNVGLAAGGQVKGYSLDEPMKIEPAASLIHNGVGSHLAQALMAPGMGSQVPYSMLAGLQPGDDIARMLHSSKQELERLEVEKQGGSVEAPNRLEKDLASLMTNLAALTTQMSQFEQQMRVNMMTNQNQGVGFGSPFPGLDYAHAPFGEDGWAAPHSKASYSDALGHGAEAGNDYMALPPAAMMKGKKGAGVSQQAQTAMVQV